MVAKKLYNFNVNEITFLNKVYEIRKNAIRITRHKWIQKQAVGYFFRIGLTSKLKKLNNRPILWTAALFWDLYSVSLNVRITGKTTILFIEYYHVLLQ